MTFQPVIPAGGNVGWSFLKSTRENQQAAFNASTQVERDTTYFLDNIGKVQSAEALVSDRRLLSVALGAFGLDEDIGNRFFIRKVLEEGVLTDDRSFANRLSDKRYAELSRTFSFDLSPPNTGRSGFGDQLVASYRERQFEIAVGQQDENLRLALGVERDLQNLADRQVDEDIGWFVIMGNPPLRRVFETALGLPTSFGAIDIDKQLDVFRDKSLRVFGTSNPAEFAQDDAREDLVRMFLLRAEAAAFTAGSARGSVALSLLQSQTLAS